MPTSRTSKNHYILIILCIFFCAANLRAPVTIVGPLLNNIGDEYQLNASLLGFVMTLPVLAFGFFSPIASWISTQVGLMKALFFGMCLIILGFLLRYIPITITLYLGTLVIGMGIAFGNVLLPAVVKTFFPNQLSIITTGYVFFMGLVAATGSALMVPMTEQWHLTTQSSLTLLVFIPIIAAFLCLPLLGKTSANSQTAHTPDKKIKIWRFSMAWYITLFSGLNSSIYYAVMTWWPNILESTGLSAQEAGNMHGLLQLATALPGLLIVPLIRKMKDQKFIALLLTCSQVISFLGILFLSQWAIVWTVLLGFSSGGVFLLGLIFVGIRCQHSNQVAALSAMMQTLGYIIAAITPPLFGALKDLTGTWDVALWFAILIGSLIIIFGFLSSVDRKIQ